MVDALLAADTDALEAAGDPIRDRIALLTASGAAESEMRGWLTALLAVTRWALQRLLSSEELALRYNTQAWSFLCSLSHDSPRTSAELRAGVRTGHAQISRVGRDLIGRGIVVQRHVGREAVWELTPRGRQLIAKVRAAGEPAVPVPAAPVPASTHIGSVRRRTARLPGAARRERRVATFYKAEKVKESPSEVRTVRPHPKGGWRVATGDRTVAKTATKAEAIERAREIVRKAGGGEVVLHDRLGNPHKMLQVRSSRPTL